MSALSRGPEATLLLASPSEARRLIDPRLPNVALEVTNTDVNRRHNELREEFTIWLGEQAIGWCNFVTDNAGDTRSEPEPYRRMRFDGITVRTPDRSIPLNEVPGRDPGMPKGVGLAAYLIAIEAAHSRGLPFTSQDGDLTMGSNKIWQILVRHRVARVIKAPTEPDARGKIGARYRADPQLVLS